MHVSWSHLYLHTITKSLIKEREDDGVILIHGDREETLKVLEILRLAHLLLPLLLALVYEKLQLFRTDVAIVE
jgi:hypothetical protein